MILFTSFCQNWCAGEESGKCCLAYSLDSFLRVRDESMHGVRGCQYRIRSFGFNPPSREMLREHLCTT